MVSKLQIGVLEAHPARSLDNSAVWSISIVGEPQDPADFLTFAEEAD